MAVDKHPSRRPGPPRKPPATSTTDGQANTVSKTMTGDGWMEYGSRNGKDLRIVDGHGGERNHDFRDYGLGSSEGKAPAAGRAEADEPPSRKVSKSPRPGDQKGNDEPG